MNHVRRWAAVGALLGAGVAAAAFAPAAWLAHWLADASDQRVLLAEPRGTVWRGSAVVVLGGGPGSRDATALPGRMSWRLRWHGREFTLRASHPCCLNDNLEVRARPGIGRIALQIPARQGALMQWPASLLMGLGAPWNSLQLGGVIRVTSQGIDLSSAEGRVAVNGHAELLIDGLSSRMALAPTLGDYRVSIDGQDGAGGVATLQLATRKGPLLLTGSGQWGGGQAFRFRGEARAEPGSEDALNNLLNIIGRRQGPVSILSIG